jgi:hypothetical protein
MARMKVAYRASRCLRPVVIRLNRRRVLRAARNMALAGWHETVIARVLGLSRAKCRAAMTGKDLWSREERRLMLLAFAQAARGAVAAQGQPQAARSAIGKHLVA